MKDEPPLSSPLEQASTQMERVQVAGQLVRFAAYCRLARRYLARDGEHAKTLAVTIVDDLFGQPHKPGSPADVFARSFPDIVASGLDVLRGDSELLEIAHHALSAEIGVAWAHGEGPDDIEGRFRRLGAKDLLAPVEPIEVDEYLALARVFVDGNAPATRG